MTDYVTPDQFKQRLGISDDTRDVRIAEHCTAASRKVDAFTHRAFGADTTATVRTFRPLDAATVYIDDAWSITTVAVDDADAGTYTTAWTAADYETDPANGIGTNGAAGSSTRCRCPAA